MDGLRNKYRDVKLGWGATITGSVDALKNAMNMIILRQRTRTFHPDEWGEISDYAGLSDKVVSQCEEKVITAAKELQKVVDGLQSLVDRLEVEIEQAKENDMATFPPGRADAYLRELVDAYSRELRLRRQISEDLMALRYKEADYDVIVAITAMWTGRSYTNERAIGHIERFIEIEATA